MSDLATLQRGARRARRVLFGAFGVALAGAALALAAGEDVEGPLATTGAALLVGALLIAVVVTPVGVWLSVRAMRARWRALRGAGEERPSGR